MAHAKAYICLSLVILSATESSADIGSFFNSLGDSLSSAGNTIKGGAQATFQVVKNGTVEAANVTGTATAFPQLQACQMTFYFCM